MDKTLVKKSMSVIETLNKPNVEILGDSFHIDNIETKMQKMVNYLNNIKKKLKLIQDEVLCNEIEWMIDVLLSGHLNDVIFTIDQENPDPIEVEKMLELLAEFSSEYNLQRSIENLQKKISLKKSTIILPKVFSLDDREDEVTTKLAILQLSKQEMFKIREEIFTSDFDIFSFMNTVGRDNAFYIIVGNVFYKHSLLDKIKIDTFTNFVKEIKNGYKKENFYHNDLHAADVTQTVSLILTSCNFESVLCFDKIDTLSFLFSAMVHDFKHTGQTNTFHINMQNDLALLYNDISVLENYHISETFKLLNKDNCNLFENFSKDERKILRKRIVDMILATDMSMHYKIYSGLKLKLEALGIESGRNVEKLVRLVESPVAKFDCKQEILNYTLHSADLSHNVKKFDITERWTELLMNEYWRQGDLEKENLLPVSFNCDRLTANVPKGQIGFLNGFIIPTFVLLSNIFPPLDFFVKNSQANSEIWVEKCSQQ